MSDQRGRKRERERPGRERERDREREREKKPVLSELRLRKSKKSLLYHNLKDFKSIF